MATVWRAADWYEREQYDLLGVTFTGHPDLRRILMPDDWPGHPMRKDYVEARLVQRHADDARQHARAAADLGSVDDEQARGREVMGEIILANETTGEEMTLNMGPQHPSTHGVIRFIIKTDGEIMREAVPDVGYLHRAIEHIAEKCTYEGLHAVHRSRRLRVRDAGQPRLGARRREAGRARGAGARRVSARHHRRAQPHLVALHRARGDGDGHRRDHAVHVHLARARVRQRAARDDLRRAAHLQLSPHRRRRLGHAGGLARQGAAVVRSLRAGDGRVRSADHEQRALRASGWRTWR